MAVPTLGGTCLTRARQPLTQPPPMSIYKERRSVPVIVIVIKLLGVVT